MSAARKIGYRAEFVEVRKIGVHWGAFRPGTKAQFGEITMQLDAPLKPGDAGWWEKP